MEDAEMIERFEALAQAARPVDDNDWGSTRQIGAENKFFKSVEALLPDDQFAALTRYCLKATSDEAIDEALRLVRSKFK